MFDPFLTEKQILRKLGGDKISSKVFTYDGNEDAEFETISGIRVTVLSTDVFDLSKITKIECTFANGQKVAFGKSDFVFSENGGFGNVTVSLGAQSAPVVFTGPYGGLFGYAQPGFGYCSYIEFSETIVPIDQKYLHKEINLADYGIDLLAVANSGQNQVTFEAPGLRDAIGDGTNVIFVNPSENLTLMARPTLIMRGDGFVRFQISIDFADDNSKTVIKMVFILGFGDAFADTLIIDLFT